MICQQSGVRSEVYILDCKLPQPALAMIMYGTMMAARGLGGRREAHKEVA